MDNIENWVEKYKERMDKNKPSEKLVEQTLEPVSYTHLTLPTIA